MMRLLPFVTLTAICTLLQLGRADAFSCAPPEYQGTSPCEVPVCCESGQLTTEACSDCPTCAQAEGQECGAGFEALQPLCGEGLSCFAKCECRTEVPPAADLKDGQECVFPFKYKGVSYGKCTITESINNKPWCAVNIQKGDEVPKDGEHWGDCQDQCPGTEYPCVKADLINHRGTCVDEREQHLRIGRPYAHQFNDGVEKSKAIVKCSELNAYEKERIRQEKCYCLPPKGFSTVRSLSAVLHEGEGCTKITPTSPAPPPPPGVQVLPILQKPQGWCYLAGVRDPRWNEPKDNCYGDVQWSEAAQKWWSSDACDDVPFGGVPF